jgi:hypothetical protein
LASLAHSYLRQALPSAQLDGEVRARRKEKMGQWWEFIKMVEESDLYRLFFLILLLLPKH